MKVNLTFYPDGTFHCDGLGKKRRVRIGGKPDANEPGCEACPRFDKCGMSHTSTIATSIKDLAAIKEACKALGLPAPDVGKHLVYAREINGIGVRLKNWQFPIVINQETGEISYDNHNGHWGNLDELNKFKQAYGVAKAKLIAKKNGYAVKTTTLRNGEIRVQAVDATKGKAITINVSADGETTMDGSGFKGKECDEKMKVFEQGLGKVTGRQCKIEYNQPTEVKATRKAGT